jgi:hypothetical protein
VELYLRSPYVFMGVDREDFLRIFYLGSKSKVRNFHYVSRRYTVKISVFSFTVFSLFLLESSQSEQPKMLLLSWPCRHNVRPSAPLIGITMRVGNGGFR